MSETEPPLPVVDPKSLRPIADGVWIIADRRVPLVPNIGVVVGSGAALVFDTGMGNANGLATLNVARSLAGSRPLLLTLSHFHPEHAYGAGVFKGHAHIVYNWAQGEDLARKGKSYLEMFRGMGPAIASALEGVELVAADEHYEGESHTIDLGGKTVELRTWGRAHTNADQVAFVREDGVLFAGDLAEEKTFPIFPWFPPDDADIDANGWVRALDACLALKPKVVVPGHGEVGGPEILTAVRDYIMDVGDRVAQARVAGADEAKMVETIRAEILARHPDWHFPEWIDFAVRYFAETGTRVSR